MKRNWWVNTMLLTNPDTQIYSNIKTMTKGAIKVANFGMNFNFAFKPLNLTSSVGDVTAAQSVELLFDSMTAISIFRMVLLFVCFCGVLSSSQNASAWIAGTISIIRNVTWGVIPRAMSPAQLKDPIIPAEPVPEAQAVIVFLEYRWNWLICFYIKSKETRMSSA